jgi:hypothetical protein
MIECRAIVQCATPQVDDPKLGQSTSVQANPDTANRDANGRISSQLDTVLNAGRSSTGEPDPSVS